MIDVGRAAGGLVRAALRLVRRAAVALLAAALGLGCTRTKAEPDDAAAEPPWDVGAAEPEPRPGMTWIPPGVLIAGTPRDRLPRVADEEMPGEQVVMHGFYVDVFPYPDEVGAIPSTDVSQDEAKDLCDKQGKRLCTELELERACKGPDNTSYEYGDAYKPSVCQTGSTRALVPNGVNAGCQSAFGVHDLHGGVWTWTASAWGRDGSKPGSVTLRGGNGTAGELIGRCANARPMKPDAHRPDVGFRCCAGEPNAFEVVLEVVHGEPLRWQPPDEKLAPELERLADASLETAAQKPAERFKVERTWMWHPIGNEELVIAGGCAHPPGRARCGVLVARPKSASAALASLAFVSTEWWQPTVGEVDSPRTVNLHGGDVGGAFRRKVTYEWGRIAVGPKERKRKHKGDRELRYDD